MFHIQHSRVRDPALTCGEDLRPRAQGCAAVARFLLLLQQDHHPEGIYSCTSMERMPAAHDTISYFRDIFFPPLLFSATASSPLAPCQDLVFSSKAALFKSQQVNAYFIEHTEAPRPGIFEKGSRSRSSAFCHLMGAVSNLLRGQSIHRWNGIPSFWFTVSGGHCTQAKQSMGIPEKKLSVNSPLGPKKVLDADTIKTFQLFFPFNSWAAV